MATVKYLLRNQTEKSTIYIRFIIDRKKEFRISTGLFVNAKNWSTHTGYPKQSDPNLKRLHSQLKSLENHILNQYNDSTTNGINVTGEWLKDQINVLFNRKEIVNNDYLVNYLTQFIENLPYKVNDKGKKGVSIASIKKYQTILRKLQEFETYRKKRILIKEVDLKFRTELIKYFNNVNKLNDNTTGKYIKYVKTICLDAQRNGIEVNPLLHSFKGYRADTKIIALSFEELDQIKQIKFLNDKLEVTKDWLLISCFTGQRISDFMRMNKSFIQRIQNFEFIVLNQKKTGKTVQIPLHKEVKEILNKRNGEFPPLFAKNPDSNSAIYNGNVKELCKRAGIIETIQLESKRGTDRTLFEKWELVSSHTGRRSFATNFYGDPKFPTPLLMNITGHGTEKVFLNYISKKPIDYSLQLAEIWAKDVNTAPKEMLISETAI